MDILPKQSERRDPLQKVTDRRHPNIQLKGGQKALLCGKQCNPSFSDYSIYLAPLFGIETILTNLLNEEKSLTLGIVDAMR